MKKLFILLFIISLISCKESNYQKMLYNSDFKFNSNTNSFFSEIIYFDSYEQTETKFIFFDKQGKYIGEVPINTSYSIERNRYKK